jgi:pantoate--beta-alanine ligase
MVICRTIKTLQQYLQNEQHNGKSIGFAPTMGALHQGHLSLIETSKQQCNITVCSIFVNPTQFNDIKDFEKYPTTIEADVLLLEKNGCDVLFLPSVQEMYPNGTTLTQQYALGYLETVLEGSYRPGHFQGVCQIVHRLLTIVQPHVLFIGQKDYQQCMVLAKLVELETFKNNVKIFICPTLREKSGLAMSSRNMRLNEEDRQKAIGIYNSLQYIKQHIQKGDISPVKQEAERELLHAGFEKIDYIAVANANTLEIINNWDGTTPLVCLVAAFLNGVRLIDNILL